MTEAFGGVSVGQGQIVPVRGNPGLLRAIRVLGVWDVCVVVGLCCAWGYSLVRWGGGLFPAAVLACLSVVLIVFSAWFGIDRAAHASMDSMMAWVGAAFLFRVLVVAGAVVVASYVGVYMRWVALSIVLALVAHTLAELWVLSRARVANVVPLSFHPSSREDVR